MSVAALAGGPVRVTYEAQAAIEMEMVSQETQRILSLRTSLQPSDHDMGKCERIAGHENIL